MPKRDVGVLSSVKDTIRRARLKGAVEADGILAVKFIKLLSLASKRNSFSAFFYFFFFLFFLL